MRLKNPFTYIGTKNRKNSHPKRKFFQKSFQKSFFTRNEMYDTAKRVALVKQRVRENTRRRQWRGIYGLSAACMLLFAVMMQAVVVTVFCTRLRKNNKQQEQTKEDEET